MHKNSHMQVIKRDGRKEPVSFDKVIKRLRNLCGGLETVDPIVVAQKVCGQIHDGVNTHQLDELSAEICTSMSTDNAEFGILASRIIISNNHKNTSPSFSETMYILYNNKDIHGKPSPLIAEDVYKVIMDNKSKLNSVIDYNRDYNFDYFAYKTLEKAYLMKVNKKVVERIQHMYMRVSIGIHSNDINKAIESYQLMSQKYFTQATPTLYHAGTPRPQNSSCFDKDMEVFTIEGVKKIINVNIGDEVVTHNGNIKRVTQLHKNKLEDRKMFELDVYKSKAIKVTGNHKFWAIKDRKDKPNWYRVDELNNKSYIAIPNKKVYNKEYNTIDLLEYLNIIIDNIGDYIVNVENDKLQLKSTKNDCSVEQNLCNRYIKLNEDFFYFSGIFLGNEYFVKNEKQSVISNNISNSDTTLLLLIKNIFGLQFYNPNTECKDINQLLLSSIPISRLLKYLFSNYSDDKYLNKFIYNCDKLCLDNLLAGLIVSSGYFTKKREIEVKLSDNELVNKLYHLMRINNIDCSLTNNEYTLRIPVIKGILEKVVKTFKDDSIQKLLDSIEDNTESDYLCMKDSNKFLKINSLREIEYNEEFVYTLGVEDDHSYNIEGLVCENCYLLGTGDSISSIYKTISDCAKISKWAGGIGVHISNVRSKGTTIRGTNGTSDGIIPMLKVYNETAKYVNQCFTKEVIVYTKDGIKEVQNISVGDELLTRDGSFRDVMEIFKNKRNEEIIKYTIMASLFPSRCTKQHQIYILKDIGTQSTNDIRKMLENEEIQSEYASADELTEKDYAIFSIPTLVEDVKEDEELYFYLYGMFLVLGVVDENNFNLSVRNNMIRDVKEFFDNRNINYKLVDKNTFIWNVEDDIFNIVCNDGKKDICRKYLHLPEDKNKEILSGIFCNKREIRLRDRNFVSTLRYMSLRLGILLEGELKNGLYHIKYPKELEGKGNNKYVRHGDKLYCKIRKVKRVNYEGFVYDFTVDQNHNYTTDSGLVHNSGKRKGSFAIYLEPHHPDVMEFLDLRKNHGNEDERARDLFLAMWLSDLFMERVEKDMDWSLLDPDECPRLNDVYGQEYKELYKKYEDNGKATKVVKARSIWKKILDSQMETGTPYILYKDSINEKSNQKDYGVIRSSNLCVAPETKILTSNGYETISDLENREVEVWNGEEFSKTIVRKTGKNQELLKVILSNGMELRCTEYHKFYVQEGYEKNNYKMVEAKDLETNMKLIKRNLPLIDKGNEEFKYPYTHGFWCGDRTYNDNDNDKEKTLVLYGEKKELMQYLDIESNIFIMDENGNYDCCLPSDMAEKYCIPINSNLETKLEWFAGLCDANACIAKDVTNETLQLRNMELEFLRGILLMLQSIGIDSRITVSKENGYEAMYILLISLNELQKIVSLGFSPHRLCIKNNFDIQMDERYFVKIERIERVEELSDTFCFNEPIKHMGMFNGVLTGNCSEITLYSDENEYAVCTLSSIALPMFVENDNKFNYKRLEDVVRVAITNLNRIVDYNFYPVPETEYSNKKHRPLGLGVQGLADVFFKMRAPFESERAKEINKNIFETIYYSAVKTSCELAKIEGPYETFNGSPMSKGIFQFDLWKVKPSDRYDWNSLRKDVMKYGIRNSTLTAIMPTASTAQILGNTECIEPITSNIYMRSTIAGNFVVINKYLVEDLMKLGLWNKNMKDIIIASEGSIQNIDGIPQEIKNLYKTVYEIKQKAVIDMCAERGPFICQTQSMNLHFEEPTHNILHSALLYGWKLGLKTGSYYIRGRPKVRAQQFTIDPKKVKEGQESVEAQTLMCSLKNPEACEMCSG